MLVSVLFMGGLMAQITTTTKTVTNNDGFSKKGETSSQRSSTDQGSTIISTSSTGLSGLPGFPKFGNTGDINADNANYAVAKENWIKENKDIYDIYLSKGSIQSSVVLTAFPDYKVTGSPEADYKNYKSSRDKWLLENETLYQDYINSIRK